MKLHKKLTMLCADLLATVSLGVATACSFGAITADPSLLASTDSSSEQESSSIKDKDSSSSSSKDSSSEKPEEKPETANFVYRIKVQNATGYGIKGVTVRLLDGNAYTVFRFLC